MIISQPPLIHPMTPAKVVLLSGLSDPANCGLSEIQRHFLGSLQIPESWKVYWNFPYVPGPHRWRPPPLWLASMRNLRQFVLASCPGYRDAARRHWRALADSAGRLLVITLSCGLEIINHCLGPADASRSLHILALGPVAWRTPAVAHTLVQGSQDFVSRLFFRKSQVRVDGIGHLNYLQHERIWNLANNHVAAF